MKIKFLLSCLLMIACNIVYSQNISTITIEQIKTTNLIFAEHQKLLETVPLLNKQIHNLELINESWKQSDSINRLKLLKYENIIVDNKKSIKDLNKSLKRKQDIIKYGSIASICSLVLCLLLK